MRKAFGVLLFIIATLLLLSVLFSVDKLIKQISSSIFGAYSFGYIIGFVIVAVAEVILAVYLIKKGKNCFME